MTSALGQPRLELFQGSSLRATNTGWSTGGNGPAIIAAAAASGAFPLAAASADSALLVTLAPGNYTTIASAADGNSGVGLVEVYDVPSEGTQSRLANIAVRAPVGAGNDTLVAGFVVAGSQPQRFVIRAAGPALAQFGLGGALAHPELNVLSGNSVLAQNSGWSTSSDAPAISRAARQVGLFAFPSGSQDAAVIATLAPGAYTAQVTSADKVTGVALIEVYELP